MIIHHLNMLKIQSPSIPLTKLGLLLLVPFIFLSSKHSWWHWWAFWVAITAQRSITRQLSLKPTIGIKLRNGVRLSEWVMERFSTFLGQLKICIYTMTKCPHDIVNWLVQSPSKCFNRGAPCIWCFLEAATHYHHIYPSIHHLSCWFIGMSTNGRVKK